MSGEVWNGSEGARRARLIFVDDDPDVLEGLRCMLRSRRDDWEMVFCQGGEEALARMRECVFDVIVTDMRMPGMSGAQLLEEVIRLYPNMVRFVLSGYSDKETIFKSLGPTHQFLAKPCDPAVLQRAIDQALHLRRRFASESVRKIIPGIKALPGLPMLYNKLVAVLNSPNPSMERVGRLVEQDMAISAQVLHLVNSAFFGLRRHVENIPQAIALLGLETLRSLVLMSALFSSFKRVRVSGFSLDGLMRHALRVAQYARAIAMGEGMELAETENAFTAGLLHDVGKLVMATSMPEAYAQVLDLVAQGTHTLEEAERESIGVSHAEAGAYLLGLWGLPDSMLVAVAGHHHPREAFEQAFNTLTLVHVANAFDHGDIRRADGPWTGLIDGAYLEHMGKAQLLVLWRRMCRQLKG